MSDATKIEWADATWNPIIGCSRVSEGCRHCYAERQAMRWSRDGKPYHGLVRNGPRGPQWTGKTELLYDRLLTPMRWRAPRRIFVNSMGDLFHEDVHSEEIQAVFHAMGAAPQHTYLILTKRPARARSWFMARAGKGDPWWRRTWLGVSVEDQRTADERIPILLDTPAARRFISAEPLIGCINLSPRWTVWRQSRHPALLDWVICGGESGPGARPMGLGSARLLRDQCNFAGIPFFFKQWGEWAPAPDEAMNFSQAEKHALALGKKFEHYSDGTTMIRVGKKAAGRELDGREWNEVPITTPLFLDGVEP